VVIDLVEQSPLFLPTVAHIHGLPKPLVPHYRSHLVSVVGREEEARGLEVALNGACLCVLAFKGSS
jgi:hypothetical protein